MTIECANKFFQLIETLYEEDGELILFTAGNWPKNIGKILAEHIPLPSHIKDKFSQCECISVSSDIENFFPIETGDINAENNARALVQQMTKGMRFEWWKSVRNWNDSAFILLDNSRAQLDSCRGKESFYTIHATTEISSEDCFYDEAINRIKELSNSRKEEPLPSINALFGSSVEAPKIEDLLKFSAFGQRLENQNKMGFSFLLDEPKDKDDTTHSSPNQ